MSQSAPTSNPPGLTDDELIAALVLVDPILFRLFFFRDEYKLPPSREQLLLMADQSTHILHCTARKISKTLMLEAQILYDGINNEAQPGGVDEGLFFTPGEAHMSPFLDRLTSRIQRTPIINLFVTRMERGQNPIFDFPSLRYYFRIEGMGGTDRNMVGLRAKFVRGDELAFGNWVNHNSRLQTAMPGARWMYSGVPNGVRMTPFWALDQTDLGATWSRHKWPTYINPLYQDNFELRRQELINAYGGEDTQGYVTQVLGEWGEEMTSSFPPESIAVHAMPFFARSVSGVDVSQDTDENRIGVLLSVGGVRCHRFALGWDYGYNPDPSVVTGAYQEHEGRDVWRSHFRVEMRRMPLPAQVLVVKYLIRKIFVGGFAACSSDNVAAIQAMQSVMPDVASQFIIADPGGSVEIPVVMKSDNPEQGYVIPGAGEGNTKIYKVRRKEFYTTLLRQWMQQARSSSPGVHFWMGSDNATYEQLVGTSERRTAAGYTVYISLPDSERKGGVLDHNVDSLRFLVHAIWEGSSTAEAQETEDDYLSALGWVLNKLGEEAVPKWQAPWDRG